MIDYFQLPSCDDRPESTLPPRLKVKADSSAPQSHDLPRELNFVANARNFQDVAPLIRVFQKHPHIRQAVITALRDEGLTS